MSIQNEPSFRYPFNLEGKVHPEAVQAIRYAFNGLKDLNSAIGSLTTKLNAIPAGTTTTTAGTTSTATASSGSSGSSGPSGGSAGGQLVTPNTAGGVTNQTGNIAYTLQNANYGGLVILGAAGGVTLTLNNAVTKPFYSVIANFGLGTVTAQPTSGTVNNLASWPISTNQSVIVFFDGINWWITPVQNPVLPQTIAPVLSNWLNSYDAATGLFTAAQPAASDLSNGVTGTGALVLGTSPTINTPSLPGLPVFANNAAAITGGLVAGNLYRTGTDDPDFIAVVH